MTRLNTQFSVKGISLLNSVMASSSSVQFKKFLFNQSTILLEIKCPQLSKPERQRQGTKTPLVTERRKKPWEKPGSVGGPFLLWPDDTAVQFQLLQSQIGGLNWFPRSCPDGCLVTGSSLGVCLWGSSRCPGLR